MKQLIADAAASVSVFLVALPLCLGISMASDAPLISGIISGIIGGVIVGYFGGSKVSVSGPAAGLTVIVASAIQELGSFSHFRIALILAGFMQLLFAVLGADQFAKKIPQSVVKGMLSAIGVLICIKELPYILGGTSFKNMSFSIEEIRWAILAISMSTALGIYLWEKMQKKFQKIRYIPSSLVGVLFGALLSGLINEIYSNSVRLDDFVQLPSLIKEFKILSPAIEYFNYTVFKTSFVIAIIASIETLLCLEATYQLDPLKRSIHGRKEILAQGLGNLSSGWLGGLPITAVIVRSAANINAGAQTKKSAIFHGVLLATAAIFFSNLVNKMPLSSLAVVLIFVGYKLFSPKIFIEKIKKGTLNFSTFIITIVFILMTDLLIGVIAGTLYYYLANYYLKGFKMYSCEL